MNRLSLVLSLVLLVILLGIFSTGCSGLASTTTTGPVATAPSITIQPTSKAVTAGQTASFSVAATGTAPLNYQWKKNGIAVSGASSSAYTTPATSTSDSGAQFTVIVSNSAGSVTSSAGVLTVSASIPALQITSSQLPGGTVGSAYSATLNASGGSTPYTWSVTSGALPNGLTLNSAGSVSGTPSIGGSFPFTVQAQDAAAHSASASLTITVSASIPPLQITGSQLPDGTVGSAYSATLNASGGTSPYSWSVSSGTLPTGLSLSSSGTLSGTPTVAGAFPFTVAVKDAASGSASASLSINVVTAAAPSVSISSPANGATVSGTTTVSGVASDGLTITSVQLSVDGGAFANASGTTNWSFSLNTNSLSNGPHTLSAKVNDSTGSATSSVVNFSVNNASTSSDCTLFASPSGSSSNSGTSPSSPKSFSSAASASGPGSVVCLLGGTYTLSSSFSPPTSGSPSSWITYKNYDSTPVNFVWSGGSNASAMFYIGGGSFPSGPAYLEFRGLNLNGNANAADGFFCRGSHHLRFISNSISNTGGSGIASIDCDYLTSDHNLINHNGFIPSGTANPQWYSWTSAISYNSNQWFDNHPGFHNIISNNIISGEVDQSTHNTDGNGIILAPSSGSYAPSTAHTPPALILHNVVYRNGCPCN